ncbi:MAG: hypothetical protein JWQ90_1203 [Hydrocarboniphaga sp.]|nr:hypothetical protein [Hydrocarboniphaga sp.]
MSAIEAFKTTIADKVRSYSRVPFLRENPRVLRPARSPVGEHRHGLEYRTDANGAEPLCDSVDLRVQRP